MLRLFGDYLAIICFDILSRFVHGCVTVLDGFAVRAFQRAIRQAVERRKTAIAHPIQWFILTLVWAQEKLKDFTHG